jgi:hypothetical protein
LATELGVAAAPSEWLLADTVRLTIGTDFPGTDYLGADMYTSTNSGSTGSGTAESSESGGTETTESTPITTVAATATGTYTPAPTDLSQMTASGIPCVK